MTDSGLSLCLAGTEFHELESTRGHRYGIWLTSAPNHDPRAGEPLPVVYVLDGNWAVGQTAPLIVMQGDLMLPIRPYLQVSVGFVGDEASDWTRVRNRDLVPPGEPVAPEMVDALRETAKTGLVTKEYVDAYLSDLANTHADHFLDFLVSELHPWLASIFNVSDSGHGMFGYSYGGLFALYAWASGTMLFDSIGAGSPGIATPTSTLFADLEEMNQPGRAGGTLLHMTLNEAELTGNQPLYRSVSRNALQWFEQARGGKYADALSIAVLSETHMTGLQSSFLSYQRTCRAQR